MSASATARTHATDLGEPLETYAVSPLKSFAYVIGFVFLGLIGVGIYQYSDAEGKLHFQVFKALMVFLFVGLGVAGIGKAIGDFGRRIELCANGFVDVRRGRREAFAWSDIKEVFVSVTEQYVNGIHTGTTYGYTVVRRDGRKAQVSNEFGDVQQLGDAISGAVQERILPGALAALRAGRPVKFGDLSVQRGGLLKGSESVPWTEVEEVTVENGDFIVKKAGKWTAWYRRSCGTIPNFLVLMTLVKDQIGARCSA